MPPDLPAAVAACTDKSGGCPHHLRAALSRCGCTCHSGGELSVAQLEVRCPFVLGSATVAGVLPAQGTTGHGNDGASGEWVDPSLQQSDDIAATDSGAHEVSKRWQC